MNGLCPYCKHYTMDVNCHSCSRGFVADLVEQKDAIDEQLKLTRQEVSQLQKQVAGFANQSTDWNRLLNESEEEADRLNQELTLTRQEVVAKDRLIEQLQADNTRLREGQFTNLELQQLCHNFPPEKVCAFRKGCLQYQMKLFGKEPVQADLDRELRWALRQIVYRDGSDRMAELMAELLVSETATQLPSPKESKNAPNTPSV